MAVRLSCTVILTAVGHYWYPVCTIEIALRRWVVGSDTVGGTATDLSI